MQKQEGPKFGAGSFQAWMRQGLAEIRQAASLGGNVEQPTPYGMYGNPTPGEVAQGKEPSPSEVLDNPKAYLPEQGRDHGNQNDHGREM